MSSSGTSTSKNVGRRLSKANNGQATQQLYDGLDIVQQFDVVGMTSYLRSLNIDEAFSFTNRNGTYFSIYDPLGSTLGVTDSAASSVVQYTYDPFGTTASTDPTFPNPFQYTGRENDDIAGLYYYRSRYYPPRLHRFPSEDPVGLAAGLNVYSYVGNNPLSGTDPLGLYTGSVCIKGTLGFGLGFGGGSCINFGYDKKQGFSTSLSSTAGGGAFAGIGGAVGISLIASNAPTVFDLTGGSVSMGAGGGAVLVLGAGRSVSFNEQVKSVEGFGGVGLKVGTGITSPFAIEGFINTTSTIVGYGTRAGFVVP